MLKFEVYFWDPGIRQAFPEIKMCEGEDHHGMLEVPTDSLVAFIKAHPLYAIAIKYHPGDDAMEMRISSRWFKTY